MSTLAGIMLTRNIRSKFEDIRQRMIAAGLARCTLSKYEFETAPVNSNLFNIQLLLEDVLFTGITQFVIEEPSFDDNASEITVHIGSLRGKMTVVHNVYPGEISGNVTILQMRAITKMKLDSNQGGIDVHIIHQETSIEEIKSNVKLMVNGNDYSSFVNRFLTNLLPSLLDQLMNIFKKPIEAILKYSCDRQYVEMF